MTMAVNKTRVAPQEAQRRKRPAVGHHARRSDRRRRQNVQNANRFRNEVRRGRQFLPARHRPSRRRPVGVVELMIVVGSGVTGGSGFLAVLRISVVVDLASGRVPVVSPEDAG